MAMRIAYGLLGSAAAALIFAAPRLVSRPWLASIWLTALFAVHFFLLWVWYAKPAHRDERNNFAFAVFAAIIAQALFVFAPFYFSDDSVRHIFDGVYLLKGVDVYTIPPRELGPLNGLLPNHPHLPTVYLPATQMQAVLGALISDRYGFPLIYHFVCALLIAGVFQWAQKDERSLFAGFVFSPFFLIAAASRHADIQGVLLVLLCLVLLKGNGIFPAAAGGLAAFLPGLKPEGFIWYAGLTALFLLRVSRDNWRSMLPAWFGAGAAVVLIQAIFARVVMFPTSESLEGFRSTAIFFSNWFTAYNPFIALRSWSGTGLYSAIQEYRAAFLMVMLPISAAMLTWSVLKAREAARAGRLRAFLKELAPNFLLLLLGGMILSRAVWNPWYFLWLPPALYLARRLRIAAGLLVILPLFYLPVIQLRARGDWDFSTFIPFYFLAAAAALFWFLLTGMGAHPLIRRIWDPDKNHP